jgi:hypothetical protein
MIQDFRISKREDKHSNLIFNTIKKLINKELTTIKNR